MTILEGWRTKKKEQQASADLVMVIKFVESFYDGFSQTENESLRQTAV